MARSRTIGWTRDSEREALARLQREHPVVLVYIRQSRTDFDVDGRIIGISLEQQEADCRRLPELISCPVEAYKDADRSGKETLRRPGYLGMMERIRTAPEGAIGAVVVYDGSRLHRNDMAFFAFMAEMEERGILVIDVKREIRNTDKLGWKMRAVFAQEERERIAERVRDGLRHLQRNGRLLGHAPLGYRRVDKGMGSRLELDPIAAPVVKSVFELYASGRFSFQTLARHLGAEGISVPPNADYPKMRTVWHLGLLKDLLHNPSYLGMVRVDGELRRGSHPALVDEETFAAAQAVRVGNRIRKTEYRLRVHPYALTGLLICERCFGRLQGHQRMVPLKTGGEHLLTYYRCANKYTDRRCDAPWIRAEIVEQALRENLAFCVGLGMASADRLARLTAGLAKAPNPRKTLDEALKRLDVKEQKLRWLFIEREELTQSEYMEKQNAINLERQTARKAAETAPAEEFAWAATQIGNLVGVWDSATAATKGQLLRKMFTRIEVNTVDADAATPALVGVQCVPQPAWWNFFHRVVVDLQSGKPYVFKLAYMADIGLGSYFARVAGGEAIAQRG